jgi:hypothetical protein
VHQVKGHFALGSVLLAASAVYGQLPKSSALSAEDERSLRGELLRLERLSEWAADKAVMDFALARTWAAGQQWPEVMEILRRIDPGSGIDPARERLFASLRGTAEFEAVVERIREANPRVMASRDAFVVGEGDLVPESMAYDPDGKWFYFGSLKRGKVVRCTSGGACQDFVTGLGTILGMKVRGKTLWLLSNSEHESAVMLYEVRTGQLIGKHTVGDGHLFNDLVISATGEAFITDTRGGAVWRIAPGAQELVMLPGGFEFANGIAMSKDARLLYVSTFPDGITVFDLQTQTSSPLQRPAALCLANVDGLYFFGGDLIAIQNGIMAPRVIRIELAGRGRAVAGFKVLERGNPLFDGVTTGVVVGKSFYYMANIQDDKATGFKPISVLRVGL